MGPLKQPTGGASVLGFVKDYVFACRVAAPFLLACVGLAVMGALWIGAWAATAFASIALAGGLVSALLRERLSKAMLAERIRATECETAARLNFNKAEWDGKAKLIEQTLNHMNQGVAVIRPDGRFWLYNKRALEYGGIDDPPFPATTRAVVEQQFRNGEFGPDGSLLPEDVRRFLLTGEGRPPKSYVRRRPNGVILEIRSDPMPDGSLIQTYTDITELARAKEAAEAAARAKANFLAVMSHEIRTPLNGVLGAAQVLRQTSLSRAQESYVQTISSCGEALLALIDDILDISRLDAVASALQERVVDPREALRQAFLVTQAAGEAKGLRMAIEGLETLPAAILVDGARLKQAVINLLGNAVKFTQAGEVVLSARIHAQNDAQEGAHEGANSPALRIVVRDTGVGLAPEALARVFEPFEQGGEAQARFGGVGLGLSIVRAIVRSMGGRVEAESEPGVGSSFGFEIPLRLAQAAPARRPAPIGAAPERGPSRRILVAEDVGTNQMVIEALLASLGHRATIVGDGAQALARAAEEPFDLIMLDMRMPHLDGLETARRLRAMDGPAARLPIVALTANAFPQDREACRLAGMDDFLSKPFDRAQIEAVIQRLCAEPQGAPMTNATTDDAQPAPENPAAVCEAPRCAAPAFAVEGATLHLCARHAQAVPEPLRARLARAARRRARLQAYWDDEAAYAALVASGRYLKLAHASCCAEEHEEAARQSALLAILLAEGTQTDAAPDAPRRIA